MRFDGFKLIQYERVKPNDRNEKFNETHFNAVKRQKTHERCNFIERWLLFCLSVSGWNTRYKIHSDRGCWQFTWIVAKRLTKHMNAELFGFVEFLCYCFFYFTLFLFVTPVCHSLIHRSLVTFACVCVFVLATTDFGHCFMLLSYIALVLWSKFRFLSIAGWNVLQLQWTVQWI